MKFTNSSSAKRLRILSGLLPLITGMGLFAGIATQYVTESRQDIETALNNPYIMRGTAVNTAGGLQLIPGSMPKDLAINQEIYNDRAALRTAIINLKDMISKAGLRYNFSNEFLLLNTQLDTILAELENALRTKLIQ